MQRWLRTTHIHRKIKLKDIEKSCGCVVVGARQASTSESGRPEPEVLPYVTNRNPRNLEMLRIERKTRGFAMDKRNDSWWNKLLFEVTNSHTTGSVVHHTAGIIVSASSKEWCIRKHLYSGRDVSAAINIGRVLAHRCLLAGIDNLCVEFTQEERQLEKIGLFLNALESGGVEVSELPEFGSPGHWGRGGDVKRYHNKHIISDIDEESCDYSTPPPPLTIPHDDMPYPDENYNLARLSFFEKENHLFKTEENTAEMRHLRRQHQENKSKLKNEN